jgi:hypothetical protein
MMAVTVMQRFMLQICQVTVIHIYPDSLFVCNTFQSIWINEYVTLLHTMLYVALTMVLSPVKIFFLRIQSRYLIRVLLIYYTHGKNLVSSFLHFPCDGLFVLVLRLEHSAGKLSNSKCSSHNSWILTIVCQIFIIFLNSIIKHDGKRKLDDP